MSEPEAHSAGDENLSPSLEIRQASWWGIYILACLTFPFGAKASLLTFWFVVLLPVGLAYDFSFLCEYLLQCFGFNEDWSGFFTTTGAIVAYFVFYVHYRLTCASGKHRNFRLLMASLVLLLVACIVGWHKAPPVITG